MKTYTVVCLLLIISGLILVVMGTFRDTSIGFPCYEDEFAWITPHGYMCETIDDVAPEVFKGGRIVK